MKIEEAMVYLLATSQHGMKTEQIARELELRGLVPRRPGRPPLDWKFRLVVGLWHLIPRGLWKRSAVSRPGLSK